MSYSKDLLFDLYELGRMYYDLGYFIPAEKVFAGLAAIDQGATPARVGLGLIKLESGLMDDAAAYFREGLEIEELKVSAKLGLAASFIAKAEFPRARSILGQVERDMEKDSSVTEGVHTLWRALLMRSEAVAGQ